MTAEGSGVEDVLRESDREIVREFAAQSTIKKGACTPIGEWVVSKFEPTLGAIRPKITGMVCEVPN